MPKRKISDKKYCLYRTINLINGRMYIGVKSNEANEYYIGGGSLLRKAINKYGRTVNA